uniref:Ground-like domain-containing protein n=1 Tax=Panagrolaimus superbus TaxID=310955 RepID=A0A914YYE8_9BILA
MVVHVQVVAQLRTMHVHPHLFVTQDCCATCPIPCQVKYVKQIFSNKRQKRQFDDNNVDEDEEEINTTNDDDAIPFPTEFDTTSNDLKCNSERLRNIIVTSKGKDITVIKRNIQLIAEKQFNHKYNVICSADGDFSYITNTDEHCQDIVSENTCYIFKQIKRSV